VLTSPVSFTGFVLRLVFFSVAPFAIVAAAELFPVRGALIDVGLALSVFLAGETIRRQARRYTPLKWFLKEALAFEIYYRERPPRNFAYYVFYPFLFPYWLWNREARREFLMFRGYTAGGLAILIGSLVWQYFRYWRPELGLEEFLPAVLMTLAVETLLVLSLLMPIATTVVWYHSTFRRGRLLIVLLAGLLSTGAALWHVSLRRDPIVSYSTRQRLRLRTKASPTEAHRALLTGARNAWKALVRLPGLDDGDGKVEGVPLERMRQSLAPFYKDDEAAAFDLWGSPRKHPRILVLYIEGRPKKPPIWVAIDGYGNEIRKFSDLPPGAGAAMKRAADGTDPVLLVWGNDSH
jgi:hypothetical protein